MLPLCQYNCTKKDTDSYFTLRFTLSVHMYFRSGMTSQKGLRVSRLNHEQKHMKVWLGFGLGLRLS